MLAAWVLILSIWPHLVTVITKIYITLFSYFKVCSFNCAYTEGFATLCINWGLQDLIYKLSTWPLQVMVDEKFFSFYLFIFIVLCVWVCLPPVCLWTTHAGDWRGGESTCGCWDLNSSPLQQQVLLITEPSLQPKGMVGFYL